MYKIENDPQCSDVAIDCDALNLLHATRTNISILLHTIKKLVQNIVEPVATLEIATDEEVELEDSSSFIPLFPNPPWELQEIRDTLQIEDIIQDTFPWPEINYNPMNE